MQFTTNKVDNQTNGGSCMYTALWTQGSWALGVVVRFVRWVPDDDNYVLAWS